MAETTVLEISHATRDTTHRHQLPAVICTAKGRGDTGPPDEDCIANAAPAVGALAGGRLSRAWGEFLDSPRVFILKPPVSAPPMGETHSWPARNPAPSAGFTTAKKALCLRVKAFSCVLRDLIAALLRLAGPECPGGHLAGGGGQGGGDPGPSQPVVRVEEVLWTCHPDAGPPSRPSCRRAVCGTAPLPQPA